jgi:hypothetical protein
MITVLYEIHGDMARSGHGLLKVSPGSAMPYPSTPCGRTAPETALWLFQALPARRAGGLQQSSTPLYTPRHTPMIKVAVKVLTQHIQTSEHGAAESYGHVKDNKERHEGNYGA